MHLYSIAVGDRKKMELSSLLLLSLVCLLCSKASWSAEVYVDSVDGYEDNCTSLQAILRMETPQDSAVPCKTLNDALGNVDCNRNCSADIPIVHSVVTLADGVHVLTGCIAIRGGMNLTVKAENIGMATVKCARNERFGNIDSCLTNGLVFQGINFEGCGPDMPNVFLNGTDHVVFENCSFRGNLGPPLQAQFVPSLKLIHTKFLDNINQVTGEGENNKNLTILELFTSITTSAGLTYFSRDTKVELIIDGCVFLNNTAEVAEINNSEPELLTPDGHGGALLIRLSNLTGARIEIVNSVFEDNTAGVDGGGIFFSLSDNFVSSNILVGNNTFRRNSALQSTGGAISYNIYSLTFNNSMLIENCLFTNNRGDAGGAVAVSLYASSAANIELQDRVALENCEFTNNNAKDEGTAVGLFSLVGVEEFGFPVSFINCSFLKNSYSIGQTPDHAAAILAFRFPVIFRGVNFIIGNEGGGVLLLNTRMRVTGELLIQDNHAMRGGGIAMEDTCVIEITPGVNISFISNSAELTGGAIHVTFPPIRYTTTIFNRLCFMQYSTPGIFDVPPHRWENVSISFIENRAELSGAALYASDLQLCMWIGNEYTNNETRSIFELPDEIADLSPFYYRDNVVNSNQSNPNLATAPNQVFVTPNTQSSIVQSGELVSLNVLTKDEVGNTREAILALDSPKENTVLMGISAGSNESITYLVPATNLLSRTQECSPNFVEDFHLNFTLPGTLTSASLLSLRLAGCHPGYKFSSDQCTCICDLDQPNILRCQDQGRYLLLQNGAWGNTVQRIEGTRELVTGYPPVNYLTCDDNGQGRLPGCLFMWDNVDAQCVTGREGVLCGSCSEGYGVSLDLQQCIKDDNNSCTWGLALFVILCFAVILMSFLILFFNIGLPNELKGFLFYVQVVGLLFRPYLSLESVTDSQLITSLSVIVNIMGFSVPIPLCISTSVQAQHVALLGYISPMLAVTTMVVYVLCARCLKVLSNRSALSGITLLSLFVYKYIADTSFTLLSCSPLGDDWVFIYNGSASCSSLELIFVIIFALCVVLTFVGPAPLAVVYICVKRPQRFQQYADELTNGLRTKHRWFGGYDIARRLPFVIFGFITIQPSVVLMLMIVGAVTILLIHMLVQPYEKKYINIIETLILMDLVAVGVISLSPSIFRFPQGLLAVLLLAPFAYGITFLFCKMISLLRKRFTTKNNSTAEKPHLPEKWAKDGMRLLKRGTTMILESEQMKSTQSRKRDSTTVDSNPTELDEFAELRESLLDT